MSGQETCEAGAGERRPRPAAGWMLEGQRKTLDVAGELLPCLDFPSGND